MSEPIEEEVVPSVEEVVEPIIPSLEPVEEYTPNFSYNFKDEEKSFDERLHSIVKTKEDEDWIRDLVTRSEGIDDIKSDRDKWKTDHGQVHEQAGLLSKGYQNMVDWREAGQLDKLFGAFKLDDQAIIDYALKRAEFYELPEEQQTKIKEDKSVQTEVAALRAEIAGFKTEQGQASVASEISQLNSLIGVPEHKPVVDALMSMGIAADAKAVSELVVQHGMFVFQNTGKEPTLSEAVNQVMDKYKGLIPSISGEGNPAGLGKKPTLPKLSGGSGKPVDRPISSLQQLKELAAQVSS